MSKGGNEQEKQAKIREAKRQGMSASEAGVSTGADKQIGHGDQEGDLARMHQEKGKS